MSEKSTKLDYKDLILIILMGTVGSTFFGILTFGKEVFNPDLPGLQFPAFGAIGSAVFALLKYGRQRDAVFVAIILGFFNVVIVDFRDMTFMITYIVYFISVYLSILLFVKKFYLSLKVNIVARPLVLSSILAIAFEICTIICWNIFSHDVPKLYILRNMPIGFLIGLGIGGGIEVADRFQVNYKQKSAPKDNESE